MNSLATRIRPALANGRIAVPLTAGICLILLTVILKNIIQLPAAQLSSDILLYILIYFGFIVSFPLADASRNDASRPILWMGAIVLTTLGIITVYAI